MPVRLSKCSLSEKETQAVTEALDSAFLGMGKQVQTLEENLKAFLATDLDVLCVNTGTSALHLALLAIDVGSGDEVLVPSITFVASYQAISATGATPVSCEICPQTGFIDLDDARRRITANTKAIMPVHYASDVSGREGVFALAREFGLRVIEDAAHAFGTRTPDGLVGVNGDILCFSFDGIKNITCGEGGAVVTGDKLVAERVRDARLLGVEKDTEKRFSGQRSWTFDVRRQGFRYHMSNIMAAIGIAQLSRAEELFAKRRKWMNMYLDGLAGYAKVKPLKLNYESIVPHIFVVKCSEGDKLREHLTQSGIETGVHYYPNHLLSLYRTKYPLRHAEDWTRQALTLPMHPDLTESEVRGVIDAVHAF